MDKADHQQSPAPIIHYKRCSQINSTEPLGQSAGGHSFTGASSTSSQDAANDQQTSHAFIDDALQTIELSPGPLPNYSGGLSGHSHTSLYLHNALQPPHRQTSLAYLDNTIQLTPPFPSSRSDIPITFEQSPRDTAYIEPSADAFDPQFQYSVNNLQDSLVPFNSTNRGQTSLAHLDNALSLPFPSSSDFPISFEQSPRDTAYIEQYTAAFIDAQHQYPVNDLRDSLVPEGLQLSPLFNSNNNGNFSIGLEQSPRDTAYIEPCAVAFIDPQHRYPVNDLRDSLLPESLQLSTPFNSSSRSLEQSPRDTACIEQSAGFQYPVNDQLPSLAYLENALQLSSQSHDFGQPSTAIVPLRPASPGKPTTISQTFRNFNCPSAPCPGCWMRKIKCVRNVSGSRDPRCPRCIKNHIPQRVCDQERITKFEIFGKWKDPMYEKLFTTVQSRNWNSQRTVELRHYPEGPSLKVDCCDFDPTDHFQWHALRKDSSGWHEVETTSFRLLNPITDISAYVRQCMKYAIYEAVNAGDIASFFFKQACKYSDIPVISQCFEMWTNLRLMTKGWRFDGTETLGMVEVKDINSAFNGDTPVPRMVTNQLNHLFELEMARLDSEILNCVQDMLQKREKRMWVVRTLALWLLLHTREVDAGRNFFWARYKDERNFWIHPSRPRMLIEGAAASSSSLLSHFHYTIGRKPLDMEWDNDESKKTVDGDLQFIDSMKELQRYVSLLIGQKACDVYQDGNPKSVSCTASLLLFVENISEGCEVRGFY